MRLARGGGLTVCFTNTAVSARAVVTAEQRRGASWQSNSFSELVPALLFPRLQVTVTGRRPFPRMIPFK